MRPSLRWALAALALVCASARAFAGPPADLSDADLQRLQSLGYEPWVEEEVATTNGVAPFDPNRVSRGAVVFAERGSCRARLMENDGTVVHSWHGPDDAFWSDVELLNDGALLVLGATSDAFADQLTARYLRKLAADSSLIWQADFPAHHDIEQAPGSRLLTLSSRERKVEEFPQAELVDDLVVVLDAKGKILEEYSLYDAFRASSESLSLGPYKRIEHRNGRAVIDAFHANTVHWIRPVAGSAKQALYRDGNLLVCMRHQNRVAILDRKKRRFLWSWGPGHLEGPHSARLLANGNVLVFDNGLQRRHSRILEIDPRTDKIVWRYEPGDKAEFFTPAGGSCQRLSNGNTLVAETRRGRLFEIDRKGKVVWQFRTERPEGGKRPTIHSAKRVSAALTNALRANAHATRPR